MRPITHEKLPENPCKVDWNQLWKEQVEKLPKKKDLWNSIAPQFNEWMDKDDYPAEFISKIKIEPNDTVLDVGCGNGAITIPLAQKARSVTALDSSTRMLEFLGKKADHPSNIHMINKGLEEVDAQEIGYHDVVVASRSLNGIADIQAQLEKLDRIARKYVYITLWGVDNRKFENEMAELLGRESHQNPEYILVYNILYEMGIQANVEFLKSNTRNHYSNMDEALDRIKWRIGDLDEGEKSIIKKHLERVLTRNSDGSLTYTRTNSKWVLIWWEKSHPS
ncbi:MAG TPA: methyltransferase domain-containing protein [Methanobacteriaceae archaeon]|nr:methyltransferase domain-containing protein [Methanobacteriaceae archaeon]